MKIPILEKFMFDEPSIWVTAMTIATLISTLYLIFEEITGNHLQYSKFANSKKASTTKQGVQISSRTGMLIFYTPAFLAGLVSFYLFHFPGGNFRFLLLKFAVTFHFFKRVLEVLFVHKYSGGMILASIFPITGFYFSAAAGLITIHYLTLGQPEPSVDLKYIGLIAYIVGILGNFYHHYLLSELRKNNEKEYKIPQGGLFNLVICPHYLFEITIFVGISFISQTSLAFACAFGVALYLISRSYATRKWYTNKFEDFPKHIKCVIPYLF